MRSARFSLAQSIAEILPFGLIKMKLQTGQPSNLRGLFANVFFVGMVILLIYEDNVSADEVPAFFLKIAKNIPRVGRSGRFEDFFLKSAKNIPRIGRRDGSSEMYKANTEPAESWPSYREEEPFTGPIKRRMDYPTLTDAWSWQHFPLAIEGPPELWRTLAGYASDGSDGIDNEIWQRKKRTGSGTTDAQLN